MDTSEQYIKMCDTPEIQEDHKYIDGDWYCTLPTYVNEQTGITSQLGAFIGMYCCSCDAQDLLYRPETWLPTQDQLQEMLEGWCLELLDKFHIFCFWDDQFEELRDKMLPISMEQLWLAFVMKENHNKVWSDGEWVVDR